MPKLREHFHGVLLFFQKVLLSCFFDTVIFDGQQELTGLLGFVNVGLQPPAASLPGLHHSYQSDIPIADCQHGCITRSDLNRPQLTGKASFESVIVHSWR